MERRERRERIEGWEKREKPTELGLRWQNAVSHRFKPMPTASVATKTLHLD